MSPFWMLRLADRPAQPWKNGGGMTREIASSPPYSNLDGFHWRVSTAGVLAGGAFSSFPGIDRTILIVSGRLALETAGDVVTLGPEAEPFAFRGDDPTFGTPLDGPVLDLNVMVRRSHFGALVTKTRKGEAIAFPPSTTCLAIALNRAAVEIGGERIELDTLDAIACDGLSVPMDGLVTEGTLCLVRLQPVAAC